MTNGERILTIPRANPVDAFTMAGIVKDSGLTIEGKQRKSSDLDLAVLFEEGIDQHRRFQTKLQMTNDLEPEQKET